MGVRRFVRPRVAPAGAAELGVTALEPRGAVGRRRLLQDSGLELAEFAATVERACYLGQGAVGHPVMMAQIVEVGESRSWLQQYRREQCWRSVDVAAGDDPDEAAGGDPPDFDT